MPDTTFCCNCQHFIPSERPEYRYTYPAYCARTEASSDPVYGSKSYLPCLTARQLQGPKDCGAQGQFFQPQIALNLG